MLQTQNQTVYIDIQHLNEEKMKEIIDVIVEDIRREFNEIRECINKEIERLYNGDVIKCDRYEIEIERLGSTTLNSIANLKEKVMKELERKVRVNSLYGGIYNKLLLVRKDGEHYMQLVMTIFSIHKFRIYDIEIYSVYAYLIGK
ncbi:MAG: hypothetical protein QXT13_10535 [Pyrobaculum sp.]